MRTTLSIAAALLVALPSRAQSVPSNLNEATVAQQRKDFEAGMARQQRKFEATRTEQQNEIEILIASFEEQAAQIQKVSALLQVSKPASRIVANRP